MKKSQGLQFTWSRAKWRLGAKTDRMLPFLPPGTCFSSGSNHSTWQITSKPTVPQVRFAHAQNLPSALKIPAASAFCPSASQSSAPATRSPAVFVRFKSGPLRCRLVIGFCSYPTSHPSFSEHSHVSTRCPRRNHAIPHHSIKSRLMIQNRLEDTAGS